MRDRVDAARNDSDTALFYDLLFYGELVTKLLVSGIVAGITIDAERHRYRLQHRLVRADGIGEWNAVLMDAVTGSASVHLSDSFREDQKIISASTVAEVWQHDATVDLEKALKAFDAGRERLPHKLSLLRWFALFAELRNKTRGHGATRASACSEACPHLERSIALLVEHVPLFSRPWAYLHRNISGKFRVTMLGGDPEPYQYLKSTSEESLMDGVYLFADGMHRVDLLDTNSDAQDFYLPNGAFNEKKYELLSYLTDDRRTTESTPYLSPVDELPPSETVGFGKLEVLGKVFTNLPDQPKGYVARTQLQDELASVLQSDRHQIVTLVGRGGVGKTSLALSVLHALAVNTDYAAILWFSSRDIDLLPSGPKLVSANVLGEQDIAREFVRLLAPADAKEKSFNATKYLSEQLIVSSVGPLLLVFDNFETVRNPRELYSWIDTYIRAPNKALITTRFREFRGDYDVAVPGMTEAECETLIRQTASSLGIDHLLTQDYIAAIFSEADGHPYVVKVLLGEVAKSGKLSKVERIIAAQDEILAALFERTYVGLSPAARRLFLLLCTWRSAIPAIAIEAILLRPANERMDVPAAIEELLRMSLVELHSSEDDSTFVTVPLTAIVFGRRKLAVSPMKAAVEADAQLLKDFGASREAELRRGIGPRVTRFFTNVAERLNRPEEDLKDYQSILEYLARQYPPAWLLLSDLLEERGNITSARGALESYLERGGEPYRRMEAWQRLADLAKEQLDPASELHALVELSQQDGVPFEDISRVANRVNGLLKAEPKAVDTDEKRILIRKLIDVMAHQAEEASATDLSRLAWLCVHIKEIDRAVRYVQMGLKKDPENEYLRKLSTKLSAERGGGSTTTRRAERP